MSKVNKSFNSDKHITDTLSDVFNFMRLKSTGLSDEDAELIVKSSKISKSELEQILDNN